MPSAEWLAAGLAIAIALLALILMALRTSIRKPSKRQRELLSRFSEKALPLTSAPLYTLDKTDDNERLFKAAFTYIDARGYRTDRVVSVVICDEEFFAGYCHLRGDYRTFAWDCIDGEIMLDSGYLFSAEALKAQYV
jgi:predicted DNA-binding transcriptional regulator YafY